MATSSSPPVEIVAITRLFCSPTNPRKNDDAVPHVAASIRRFGWQQPIVARRSGEVIAGNTRLKAAQQLGMTEVPVWWFDGDDLAATAFSIADNRTHEWAHWDEPVLAKLLEQLRAEDALDGVGYSTDDIDALVQQLRDQDHADKDLVDDGADEPPAVAVAKLKDESKKKKAADYLAPSGRLCSGGWILREEQDVVLTELGARAGTDRMQRARRK